MFFFVPVFVVFNFVVFFFFFFSIFHFHFFLVLQPFWKRAFLENVASCTFRRQNARRPMWKEHEDGTSCLCSVFVVFYMSSISFAGKFKFSELTYGSYGISLRSQFFIAYARKNNAIVEYTLRCDTQKPKHNSVKRNQLLSLELTKIAL